MRSSAAVWCGLFLIPALLLAQRGSDTDSPTLTVEKLHSRAFVVRGGPRANSGVFLTSSGVVLVDVRGGWGKPLQDTITALTDRPLTTVVNTHSHQGHVTGNAEMPPGLEIIAHANARRHMSQMPVFQQAGGHGLPTRTFTDQHAFGSGDDRIELHYFGRGHTDGDIWVVFPAARIAYTDIFPGNEMPLLDAELGGSGVAMDQTLERAAAALARRVDRIITAHGPAVLPLAELRRYARFNQEFLEFVRRNKIAGRAPEHIAESWKMPAAYADYAAPTPERVRANVQVIFDEIP